MRELKILYIEDDKENREDLRDVLDGISIQDMSISIDCHESFDAELCQFSKYHIVILDLFEGVAGNNGIEAGRDVLRLIREKLFVPVIFFSGNTKSILHLRSQVIGIATKGDGGFDELKSEIIRLSAHNLPFLKESVHDHIEKEFQRYFWDVIQDQNDKFKPDDDGFSLGYMLLRNFGNSLSRNNISKILEDDSINADKAHPMAFYLYPLSIDDEYECGEIIKQKQDNGDVYVILTPSCDFVARKNTGRKAKKVLLAKTQLLKDRTEYKKYLEDAKKNKGALTELVRSKSDRFFFLPGTPFIENRVVDFQDKIMVDYECLDSDFVKIAKLDTPFAQAMATSFIRYYNRIGFPDIDTDYVLLQLK